MSVVTVTALKSVHLTDDGQQAKVTFVTKYVGDIELTMPASCVEELATALKGAKPQIDPKDALQANQLKVTMPRTWLVTADVKDRGVVVVAFDHQAETRVGYALDPDAAKKIADGLTKNADAILAEKSARAGRPAVQ
jgi:hypothetical protein